MTLTQNNLRQMEIFGSLFFLAQHVARLTDQAMAETGVTTKQWLLLAVLVKKFQGQEPTLSEAAAIYGSSRQNVKMIALQLEKLGYLRLVSDPRDGRCLRLRLTPKMRAFDSERERRRQVALMEELFSWAKRDDLERLREMFERWIGAVAPTED
jgi:DNA-binding MarR family transcriptional regulator